MNRNQSIEKAAKEARRAAERARQFAKLFEEYAACLLQDGVHSRAAELRLQGRSKLAEIREAVSDSDDWARVHEWEVETQMFDAEPQSVHSTAV